jgi:hypothetical protein
MLYSPTVTTQVDIQFIVYKPKCNFQPALGRHGAAGAKLDQQ